jgi:hypothetical protein
MTGTDEFIRFLYSIVVTNGAGKRIAATAKM